MAVDILGRSLWTARAELADGREILFFDERPVSHDVRDLRNLDPRSSGSQLRHDPLTGEWAAIAGHRQARTFKPSADECPLCPSTADRHTEVPVPQYDVVVFENRFPAFSSQSAQLSSEEPFVALPGQGRCEVVCFTSDHNRSFVELDHNRIVTVLRALAHRTEELGAMPDVEYVFCFENRGEEIGVTLLHPHGQIYALPLVPPRVAARLEANARYRAHFGQCAQCAALAAELDDGSRIVTATDLWVSYVPFAARWPYEVRVVPRRHVPSLAALTPDELDDLARVYQDVLARLDSVDGAGPVPYIAGWQQAPARIDRDGWHLGAEIFTVRRSPGRLKYLAGIESGMGLWINDIAPEVAADRLRSAR